MVETLVEKNHTAGPVSNATRGNFDVTLRVMYILRAEQNG